MENSSAFIDAEWVHGFSKACLQANFDNPAPTPKFHKEMWEMCTGPRRYVAIAAPRGHAKSSAITHSYTLSCVLSRTKQYVIIISDTEEQAAEFLGDIKRELVENALIKGLFGAFRLVKDSETNIIVRFDDGHYFRIQAKGAEQKLRGKKWRGKRPDLIVVDDLENDESVLNNERRTKLRKWFFSAVMPALSTPDGQIRMVGTILHFDSLLERLLKNDRWYSKRYRAHDKNFKNLLWPERISVEDLKEKMDMYESEGHPEGYSQEYLNYPVDIRNALFKDKDFLPRSPEDKNRNFRYYVAADFAISQKESADYTVFVVGGMDDEGILHIVDVIEDRFDGLEIVNEIFTLQLKYDPELFLVETEKIDKAIGPFLDTEMIKRGVFPNIYKEIPTKDKIQRVTGFATKVRQGGVKWEKSADWYPHVRDVLCSVTRTGVRAKHDDIPDAFAWLGLAIDKFHVANTPAEQEEEDWENEGGISFYDTGRSPVTGY